MSFSTPPHDDDEGQVRPDRGGWLSGPSVPEEDIRLAEVLAAHPGWVVWKGQRTRTWWACPPPSAWPIPLLEAATLDGLEAKILDIQTWQGGR